MTRLLLHIEGFMVLILSVYFYFQLGFSWVLFTILLFTPDLSALGYLRNNKVGSVVYNLFHMYNIPIILLILGLLLDSQASLICGLIWVAHIGINRMLGYGLKYPTKSNNTHLNRV